MLRVNEWVTHERLDGEVIAINLETGVYFALGGVAADAWSLMAAGAHLAPAIEAIAERYGVETEIVRADVTRLFAEFETTGLARVADDAPTSGSELPAPGGPLVYAPPVMERFDDLENLLLLDPIHEVDEAGWPVARTD